jgi:hypothetical protein
MSERTIHDWKHWIEQLERRKLTEGAVSLITIRPTAPPIRLLNAKGDGVHPMHSETYFRDLHLQEIPDENR